MRFPGFGDVEYPDWRTLLNRLAREAVAAGWSGPLVLDELPYLVHAAPELPSVLQRWIDHEARGLVVVAAGSSQHMMQGLVLAANAPLYGRAQQILEVLPLAPRWLPAAFGAEPARTLLEAWTAWGGVPRYWELAVEQEGTVEATIDRLVLDPMGPLHREPDRLIAEELPPAHEVRPLLDVIGGGAHRVSEIGGRLGRPATSLHRPLQRLQGMGLVRREVPFDEDERSSKRSLYRIADPFTRMWFRVVAPHRAQLATAPREARLQLLRDRWPQLLGEAWEELCRMLIPSLDARTPLGALGPWGPPSRWWRGSEPEWDLVARSLDGKRLLVGEVKVSAPDAARRELEARSLPPVAGAQEAQVVRALFVANPRPGRRAAGHPLIVTAADLLA